MQVRFFLVKMRSNFVVFIIYTRPTEHLINIHTFLLIYINVCITELVYKPTSTYRWVYKERKNTLLCLFANTYVLVCTQCVP